MHFKNAFPILRDYFVPILKNEETNFPEVYRKLKLFFGLSIGAEFSTIKKLFFNHVIAQLP